MKSYQATWEDAEASRQVELVVNYRLDAKRVDINDVTPTRVTFLCEKTQKPLRSVRVWTEGGRKLLARQAAAAGRLATLAKRSPKANSTSSSTPSTAASKPRRSCRRKRLTRVNRTREPSIEGRRLFYQRCVASHFHCHEHQDRRLAVRFSCFQRPSAVSGAVCRRLQHDQWDSRRISGYCARNSAFSFSSL